jgi:BirA family biotin operon repressor/biotin-[acetyl-CoA-carboxylase] ligase
MAAVDHLAALDATQLQRALPENLIGRRIVALESAASTNDSVLRMAEAGAEEGLVVFAEEQTAGRGQHGQRWESAARHGLWFSILLRPNLAPAHSARLTTWAAQSVAATILRELSLAATVKPPNDVHIGGRKVAGVLVEMRAQPGRPHLAIAGIGVNVSQAAGDFSPALRTTATSLALAAQRPVSRQDFAAALLRELDETYRAACAP